MYLNNFRNLYKFVKKSNSNLAVFLFSLLLIIFVIVLTSALHVDQESRNYVFSSISQGLAAFFALGFTMTFIISEKIRRDSGAGWVKDIHLHVLPMFIPLMFLYAIGIVFPQLAMQNENEFFFDICVIIGAVCFIQKSHVFLFNSS
jgi:hypothetical protein